METNTKMIGNEELLNKDISAFLCSHKVPDETFTAIRNWIDSLNPQVDCIMCGCLAGIERFALKYLINKKVPVIIALAEALPDDICEISKRLNDITLSDAMGNGRLLIMECAGSVSTETSAQSAESRNKMMMKLCKDIVVGYAMPMGNIARQLLVRSNVTYLVTSDAKLSNSNEEAPNNEHDRKVSMGWGIYEALKENYATLGSVETRKLLNQYLKLGINEPSRLHSLILLLVVKNFDVYPDLKFSAFFRIWGPDNLQDEDWKAHKINEHWIPSLAERVVGKLFHFPKGGSSKDLDKELIRMMIDKGIVKCPYNKKFTQYAEKLKKIESWRPGYGYQK